MKDLCQKWKLKLGLIFRDSHGLSGTEIIECLEIIDLNLNNSSY